MKSNATINTVLLTVGLSALGWMAARTMNLMDSTHDTVTASVVRINTMQSDISGLKDDVKDLRDKCVGRDEVTDKISAAMKRPSLRNSETQSQ